MENDLKRVLDLLYDIRESADMIITDMDNPSVMKVESYSIRACADEGFKIVSKIMRTM